MPYSNETLYRKALEYKTYFIHIDSEQIVKSLEDIQIFFSILNTECLAKRWVNILLFWFVLCFDGIWRPRRNTMVLFVLRGGGMGGGNARC